MFPDYLVLSLRDGTAHVPALWFLEVANVLVQAERHARINAADGARFVELLRTLPLVVDNDVAGFQGIGRVLALSRQYDLSTYDSSYLDLAMRKGVPLATRDRKLLTACGLAKVPVMTAT